MFTPNLSTLPAAQRALWSELEATPDNFTLYGGTALALYLGHRTSVDFYFFSNASFDPDHLAKSLAYLKEPLNNCPGSRAAEDRSFFS
ncbi:MAG: hypothetical protein EXR70_24905 [Deltaproteobacteria bacterium]|nr:hypothetical protein [Deltaproteobacteria bacterium]